MSKKALLAGESWMSYTTHVKDLIYFGDFLHHEIRENG